MTIEIENEYAPPLTLDTKGIIHEIIPACLDYVNCPYEAEVSVLLTDDASIRELNREHREIDAATDVLSFPMLDFVTPADFRVAEEHAADCFHPDTGELILGNIVISMDKVFAQAKEFGHSPKREFAFLLAHSMLHLSGYDHVEEEERREMEVKQEAILQKMGYTRD